MLVDCAQSTSTPTTLTGVQVSRTERFLSRKHMVAGLRRETSLRTISQERTTARRLTGTCLSDSQELMLCWLPMTHTSGDLLSRISKSSLTSPKQMFGGALEKIWKSVR